MDYIDGVTEMTTDELVAVSQDRDSMRWNGKKNICNYLKLFDRQITADSS